MSEPLTDDEIESITRSLGGPGLVATSKSETCRMLAELLELRAMKRRLEEWGVALEANRDKPGDVGKFIAAELRRRMEGP